MTASEQNLWRQLAESAIGRFAGAALTTVLAARSGSVAMGWVSDAAARWQGTSQSARWQLIGISVGAAVMTHVGLLTLQRLTGWWWWAIPSMAAIFAVLALVLSTAAKRTGAAD